MEVPSSFLDAPDSQPSGQLIMTEGVSNVILGLVPWLRTGAALLLVGPEGCGKATLLQHCLDQLAVCHPLTWLFMSVLSCCLLDDHAQFATARPGLAACISST
jgi:MoxR-like ATPase